ncbi:MAG: hypothetical protein A3E84_03705 [Gammaproteobacteria bacterium RIFCSPHIGHO2_12_FULL_42_13]|nr:MAG: hypothetical protein A3E84_03705 [Gammaproteobacteria bacterium RIFCSPHIGHO2_12_FULL_42_13]
MPFNRLKELIIGSHEKLALPTHVQEDIQKQQIANEKIISWIQLVVVIIFSLLYFASRKTFSSNTFAPVPWALGAYLIFSLVRLYFTYHTRLPNWFLFLSIFIDITLLLTLIWSFHLQYQQPPAFYLKAPTFLYVFIFIALRALRFEVKFVLTTGIIVAIGWSILLVYALIQSPPQVITQDYVTYMTSNRVLIGAELDKIVSILVVTAILAAAVSRGRKLLERSVIETIATKELSKFFSPEIANTIIQSGRDIKPGYGEIRDVAILHCDIRGFTIASENMSPTDLMQLLTEYQSRMVHIIRKHHGGVDKFLGDGILASFNALRENKTYAADAARAAIEMVDESKRWADERELAGLKPIKIGISLTTGKVISGVVGDASRFEFTVIGDAVNLAAKLDKQCKIEKCEALCTEAALNLAIKQGFQVTDTMTRIGERHVAGVSEPVALAILVK